MKSQNPLLPCPHRERPFSYQPSLFIKVSACAALLILVVSLVLTLFFVRKQRDILYQARLGTVKMILGHFVNGAALPLLEEDTLALNTLVREATQVNALSYAMIVDNKKTIKAHTDPTKIGRPLREFENREALAQGEAVTCQTYSLPSGIRVLNLSRPVTFMNKKVGAVHLGLSIDVINDEINKESFSLVKKAFLICLVMLALVGGTGCFLSRWMKRPEISERVPATGVGRNQVAVVCAGVKGFKAYAARAGPEKVLQDLSEYVSIATKCILDHGGYVAKIVGDTVTGVFRGSPLQADQIVRAVRSAMAMQKAFENGKRERNPLVGKVGIGISSGVVLSGYIGSQGGKKLNYIGESFKAAHSLNVAAGPGEIVISKDVYQCIENLVSVEPLPPRETTQRTGAWESFRLRKIVEGEPLDP